MNIESAIFAALFGITKNWITLPHKRKHCSKEMDFSCDSLQKYQYLPYQELSSHVVKEFEYVLGILDKPKRSVLTKRETVQRVYCLACVLWQSQDTSSDLTAVLKDDIYDVFLNWTLNAPQSIEYAHFKLAIDRVLCSMCSIKPDLYDRLLTKLNIVNTNSGCENVYNFRHVVPDSDEEIVQHSAPVDLKSINLNENMLKSLGIISLCCIPTYKLIHSKFLSVLMDLVIDFIAKDKSLVAVVPAIPATSNYPIHDTSGGGDHLSSFINGIITHPVPAVHNYPPFEGDSSLPYVSELGYQMTPIDNTVPIADFSDINIDMVSTILDFFAELCWQNVLRTWLSSEKSTLLWSYILNYLCIEVPKSQKGTRYMLTSKPNAKSMRKLEDAAVNFFSKCCDGNFKNQEKFAQVFYNVLNNGAVEGTDSLGISDFTRRVLVEFITSPGHIFVSIETDLPEGVTKIKTADLSLRLPPPAFPTSNRHQLLHLNVDRTCADILKKIRNTSKIAAVKEEENPDESQKNEDLDNTLSALDMSWENCAPSTSQQFFDTGSPTPSTSKRSIDNATCTSNSPSPKKTKTSDRDSFLSSTMRSEQSYKLMFWAPSMYQFINVSQHWSIAEILQIFVPSGDELEVPVLKFLLSKQEKMDENEDNLENAYLTPPPAIQKFVSLEGFKYITLFLEKKPPPVSTQKRPSIGPRSVKRGRSCALNHISTHTLLAFGQFLRLPEFRTNADTKSVIQSIIGLGREANFSSERYSRFFSQNVSKMCNPLMVLPFELFRLTLSRCYNNTSDVTHLDTIYAPLIDFILMYLAVYTHQPENKDFNLGHENKIYMKAIRQCCWSGKKNKNKNRPNAQSYWPKGTGYSSSHSDSSKYVANLSQIEEEEELVAALLLVLANYIGPHPNLHTSKFMDYKDDICDMQLMRALPSSMTERLKVSCLLPVIISYLKNDSVFDMVKHIPLYKAIMSLLRVMVSNVQLADLVLTASGSDTESPGTSDSQPDSIASLMGHLKSQIEDYLRRTSVSNDNSVSSSSGLTDDSDLEEQDFFKDVSDTASIIETIKSTTFAFKPVNLLSSQASQSNSDDGSKMATSNVGFDYLKMMKPLQFDQYEMTASNGTSFSIPYHFQDAALKPMVIVPSRMKRLAMEMSSLSSSLPISSESAIFVRYDENRIDVMKALITGPPGTPYMNGCFEFDIFCPSNYPSSPILMNFKTTGRGTVRFNPNLYENGKVCLSLLNTWQGENWNPQTSSILQVLVSIQGMIFIPEPYFNEPGWEANQGTNRGRASSKSYNDNLLPSTIRHAMRGQISSPSACFKKIIHTHFWLKKDEIKAQVNEWINQATGTNKQILQAEAALLFSELDRLILPD